MKDLVERVKTYKKGLLALEKSEFGARLQLAKFEA